jgi:hypothetical protein
MSMHTAVGVSRLPPAVLAAVIVGCSLSACSNGGGTSSATVSEQPRKTVAGASQADRELRIPSIGVVVVTRRSSGLRISDRATHGKRFSLAGVQAGECLSFLRANPDASERDVRAACPGESGERATAPGAATSTGP